MNTDFLCHKPKWHSQRGTRIGSKTSLNVLVWLKGNLTWTLEIICSVTWTSQFTVAPYLVWKGMRKQVKFCESRCAHLLEWCLYNMRISGPLFVVSKLFSLLIANYSRPHQLLPRSAICRWSVSRWHVYAHRHTSRTCRMNETSMLTGSACDSGIT